ncbi:MAG: hypothetical protein HY905_13700 [Deltaproteobacteria bacterium]|nr:hypothetical protein [Deltaproteobacteria bacterium]
MSRVRLVILVCVAGACLFMATSAQSEVDLKTYSGILCVESGVVSSSTLYYDSSGAQNDDAYTHSFICATTLDCYGLQNDSWIVLWDRNSSTNFSCSLVNRNAVTGSTYYGDAATTSGIEGPVQKTLDAPDTTPSYLVRYISCSVPAKYSGNRSAVVGYAIDENC